MKGRTIYRKPMITQNILGCVLALTSLAAMTFALPAYGDAHEAKAKVKVARKQVAQAEREVSRFTKEHARARSRADEIAEEIDGTQSELNRLTKQLAETPVKPEKDEGFLGKIFPWTGAPDRAELLDEVSKKNARIQKLSAEHRKAKAEAAAARKRLNAAEQRLEQANRQLARAKTQQRQATAEMKKKEAPEKTAVKKAEPPQTVKKPTVRERPEKKATKVKKAQKPQQTAAQKTSTRTRKTGAEGEQPASLREGPRVKRPEREKLERPESDPIPWTEPAKARVAPKLVNEKEITPAVEKTIDMDKPARGKTVQFDVAMVSGDKDIVETLDVWEEWAYRIAFNPVSQKDIEAFHTRLTKALQKEGYVFANVTFPTRIWNTGIFLAKVDCGPLGTVTVKGNRHYSAEQIVGNVSDGQDRRFNYADFYKDLYNLNANPDITVNTTLKPVVQDGRRVINAELTVEDNLPLHAAFEMSNTGTDDTNDWRLRTTVQHVNLTKRNDVLTFDWLTSPDVDDVNAFSGSYFLPFGDTYSLNLFAGYSESNVDDVLPHLDIRGEGYFVGGRVTNTLAETEKHRIQLSLGWFWQQFTNQHEVAGMTLMEREVEVSMPTLTIGYSAKGLDALNGRNFFSNTIMGNLGGRFGSSEDDEFTASRAGSDGNFLIDRFQFVRFQRLFAGEDGPGKWTMMLRLEGQLATAPLIAGLQKSIGGAETVRGYEEQDQAGDEAYAASVELRTPLMTNFVPGLKKSEEYLEANPNAWQKHRLQFLVFSDFGLARKKETLPDEQDEEDLSSVGAGLRLGLTKYSYVTFDYGFPLTETVDSDSGRGHLSLQLQF